MTQEAPAPAPARPWRARVAGLPGTLLVGGVIVAVIVLAALLSYLWTPYDPTAVDAPARLAAPSAAHWLGADQYGRDVVSMLLVGSRTTLFVGVVAVGVASVIGVPVGVFAGLARPALGEVVMRGNDLVLAFPALLLAIMFAAVFGAGTLTAMVAIGIASAPSFARVATSGTRQVAATEYVLAARAGGRGRLAIAVRHVLPNLASILVVQASVTFALAVLSEAALSYLGYGTQPPTPSWGRMLQESQQLIYGHVSLTLYPAVAIALAVLGFNLLGDGLRDALDPKLRRNR